MRTTIAIDEKLLDELMRVESGITVPPSDCLVAAVARRRKLHLYANDSDFDEIPDLNRYTP